MLVIMFCFVVPDVQATDMKEISARSAVVIDGKTGETVYSKNADEKLPMASTTKIMSALIVLQRNDLDKAFTVDSTAIRVEGSSMGLREGDIVTLRDLCYGMLLPSGNDAANAAAVRVAGSVEKFVEKMNRKAKELGMNDTHFVTPSGLDDYTDDHYSTASDMAKLTRAALKNDDFRKICSCESAKLKFGNPPYTRWLKNTNRLLKELDGCIGVKTGFTDKARRCLVSACERNGTQLICVTLNAPNDWDDHKTLYYNCFNYFQKQELYIGEKKLYLNVVGASSDKVKCSTDRVYATLLRDAAKNVKIKVFLPRFAYAPLKSGEQVGRVEYFYKDVKIAEGKIYAENDCEYEYSGKEEKTGFFSKLFEKLNWLLG